MLAAGPYINVPLLSKFLRGFSSLRLPWSPETDCKTAEECLKRTVSCITSIERCRGSWHFNHCLCERFVTNYLQQVRELLEERKDEIELYSEKCFPTLAALHNTVKEGEFLIQKHCTGSSSSWIKAAVELFENTSAFAEVILDLKWYMHALKIAIEVSSGNSSRQARKQRIWDLQKLAMAEYGKFLECWDSDCKQLRLERDREDLLSKLKVDNGTEIRTLQSYLAQKLGKQDQFVHASEALAVNLKASELQPQKKVLLGSGSFGKVYKIQWLGMWCALKQISGSAAGEEVRILSKVHHPNIVQLYGYFLERDTLHLIMELMESTMTEHVETSKEWAELQRSPLDFLRVALDNMLQIAKGIRYLHSQGIAHRDLKGENVLIKPSENPDLRSKGYLTVKLTDFGLAKANLRNSTCTSLTINIGSLVWKAPELFKVVQPDLSTSSKRKHYPLKPDVYSFAMLCYEILSGKIPFSDDPRIVSTTAFYARVKRGERPVLPENINFLPELADYIKRCWDTDPSRRPDFVDICKRIRHFRDSLLQITAYSGWEHKPQENGAVNPEPPAIDESDFIDITNDWNWEIGYKDIVRGEKPLPGGSGFASVWPAHWKHTEQVLAKYIEPTLIDNDNSIANFKQEVAILVRMQDKHLVSYLGATRQAPFVVVTEFAHGVTLRKFSSNKTPLSLKDALSIALQVARGMRCLHEEDVTIIHGELSPDCILIDENNLTARIADFGMRSFRKPPHSHSTSRWYRRAPEQHLGLPLHTSVDVFSFGMILYDLFERENAQHFWKNKKASDILKNGGRPVLNSASCYPPGVKALVEKCWTKDWQERPSFGSIVSDLEKSATKLSRSPSISRSSSSRDNHRV
ncbi:hypothetical protein M758_8G158200 [Ceratodon purpureus]|nr:hypothetical protein M758_8G158200 [Ceratodon purpureus]